MTSDGSALGGGAALASLTDRRRKPVLDPTPLPLAGRESELESLRSAWRRAVAGDGRMVTLAGEPGIGKTRLATEMAGRVGTNRAWVLWADCDTGAPAPYAAVVEALRHCRPELPAELIDASRSHTGPGLSLGHLLDPSPAAHAEGRSGVAAAGYHLDGSADPIATRRRMFEDATELCTRLARSAPVLLLVDDLETADQSTLALVRHLATRATGHRMLVVGTYCDTAVNRADPAFDALREIATAPGYESLVLAGLNRRAVDAIVGDKGAADDLWSASEGNPLALRYLMAMAAHDAGAPGGHGPRSDHPWPTGPQAIVDHWLGLLEDGVRHWLVGAAVIGRNFDLDLLARALHMRRDRADAAIAEAARAGIVEALTPPLEALFATAEKRHPAGTTPGSTRRHYRFTHSLFQRSLYANLAPNQLVHLHAQVAEALEEQTSTDPAHLAGLAFHLGEASPVGRSAKVLRQATALGDQAMAVGGYEDAARYYGRALAAAGAGAAAAERADLLMALADAHWRSGDHLRARTALLEAAAAARSQHDGGRLAASALGLARLAPVWGDDGVLGSLLEEALAEMESGPARGRGRTPHGSTPTRDGATSACIAAVRSCLEEIRRHG